ncbi:MAG: hypothetical protein HY574_01210 [candidate division NC10 bacterium]|nr:hypothetical protein [candidate division NC10 bacterium]
MAIKTRKSRARTIRSRGHRRKAAQLIDFTGLLALEEEQVWGPGKAR